MKEIVYHTNYKLEETYWWFQARNKIIVDLIRKYGKINEQEQILDVGCGTCGFAKALSQYFSVVGLDTSPLALEYCKKRGLNKLYLSLLKDLPKDELNIRIVTVLDVIEHIEDDNDFVKDIFNVLPKDGTLFATVPAYKFLWSIHDEVHKHFRRYKKKDIVKIIENAGFEVQFSTYFNTFLFLPGLLKRLVDKYIKPFKNQEFAVEILPKPINYIFQKVFELEKYFIPNIPFPFGLSILVIAKKK